MRIVIVEDEVKIREGMGKMIASQTNHIIVGEAADGREGLEMILRYKPDLVITDIRMPKMSGLEMVRELKERDVHLHVIILSGYAEFDYARRAITYGVDDYLLKPLAAEDVQEMLKKIEQRIREEEEAAYGLAVSKLKDILLGNVEESAEYVEEVQKSCGFEERTQYCIMAGYIGAADASYRMTVEEGVEEIKDRFPELKIYLMYQENRQILYCLAAGEELEGKILERYEHAFYNRMLASCQHKTGKAVWMKRCFFQKELGQAGDVMRAGLSYALVIRDEEWITHEIIRKYHFRQFEYPMEINNRLKNAICQSDAEKIEKTAAEFLTYMEEHSFLPHDMRYGFLKSYYLVSDTLRDIDQTLYEHLKNANILRQLEEVITWQELKSTYEDMVKIIAGPKAKREDISNYVIKKAINYIREHYQEGITLDEVSRRLDITPEYLSTLFNREVGINFSIFLKRFRISHAKRLLKGSELKVYEVAEAVGYSDAKYFARVFKEEEGVSPGDYRQMN